MSWMVRKVESFIILILGDALLRNLIALKEYDSFILLNEENQARKFLEIKSLVK